MAKILFVFGGTGEKASGVKTIYETNTFAKDVVRIYFSGCQDSAIGGSYILGKLSPNLDNAGRNVRSCFGKGEDLSLTALKKKFGDAVAIVPESTDKTIQVEELCLMGFSRGAVTTFAAARYLDNLGIPIRIFAQESVPGEDVDGALKKDSEFQKNYDLTQCKQIKQAQVVIGGYRNNVNMIHDSFFKQMAPLFGPGCDHHTYMVPKELHVSGSGIVLNQRGHFLQVIGYATEAIEYEEEQDKKFFYPNSLSQRHHAHHLMRPELLPLYKQKLVSALQKAYPNIGQYTEQTVLALYALQQFKTNSSLLINSINNFIINDKTARGAAIREFVSEFECINQYVLGLAKAKETSAEAINKYREIVYLQVKNYSLSPTKEDIERFDLVLRNGLKGVLSSKEHKILTELIDALLAECSLLQPHSISDDVAKKPARCEDEKTAVFTPISSAGRQTINAQKDLKASLAYFIDTDSELSNQGDLESETKSSSPSN